MKSSIKRLGATLAVPALVIAGLGAGFASGSSAASNAPVLATGSVACTTASGTVQFAPALTKRGNSTTETTKFNVTLSGCTTTGSNVLKIVSGTLTVTIHKTTKTKVANACTSLNTGKLATNSALTWMSSAGTNVRGSNLKTTGETWSFPVLPNLLGFTIPGAGTAAVTGSFAGSDKGAVSTFSATFANTLASFTKACSGGTHHLSKFTINGGSLSLG